MYRIIIKKKAKKFIDRLPLNEKKRIVAAIELLPNGEDNARARPTDKMRSFAICSILSRIYAAISTFFNRRSPCEYAVFALYPAAFAACVAFAVSQ